MLPMQSRRDPCARSLLRLLNMLITLESIKNNAVNRPPGYYEDVLSHGKIVGSNLDIESKEYIALVKKYSPERIKGMGDLVYKFANPIAHGIDAVLGTHIQGCGGCKKRREKLNEIMPFK
jgi:hypothetical protein